MLPGKTCSSLQLPSLASSKPGTVSDENVHKKGCLDGSKEKCSQTTVESTTHRRHISNLLDAAREGEALPQLTEQNSVEATAA